MSARVELEAALARAQAEWRRANDEMDRVQADRAKANAIWDEIVASQCKADANRRKVDRDRRKADEVLDMVIPDQRMSDADRRTEKSALAAFSEIVAARHKAYLDRSTAEAAWAAAAANLIAAIAQRKDAIAALAELSRAPSQP